MRKFMLMCVACVLAVGPTAQAIIMVDWSGTEGWWKSDGETPLLGGPGPKTALVQLIFTPDPIPDPVNPVNPNYVGGNDVFLESVITDTSTSLWGEFGKVYMGPYMAGWLFVRVFDQGSAAGVTAGMWYWDSPLTNTVDNPGPPNFPDIFDYQLMTPEFGDTLNQQVIPEPTTWALMLLGATTLVGRKLRRK